MTAVLTLCGTLLASVPAPLTHLLDAAREHNQTLGISRAQLRQQDAAVEQALATFVPALRIGGGYTRNEYAAVVSLPANLLGAGPPTQVDTLTIQPYNAWSGSVAVNVPLFTAGSFYRYAEAKQAREGAAQAERASDAEVALATARGYFRVVGAQGVAEAARRALSTAKDNLRVTEVKRAAGTQTRLATDRAEVDVARASQSLAAAMQALKLARRNVETLTGEQLTHDFPEPDAPQLPARDEAAFVSEAVQQRPELVQAAAAVRQQELALSESWALLIPSLAGTATESFTNVTGFTGQHDYWAAGVTLSWNVDPAGVRASIHRAEAAVDEQRHRLAQAQDQLRDEVHTAWLEVETGAALVAQAGSEMRSAQDALSITQQQYSAGTATSLDLSSAQRDAFNAEATLAQSRADLASSLLALEKAAGERFWAQSSGEQP